jgi:hypothetical protein
MLKQIFGASVVLAGLLFSVDASAFEFGTPASRHPFRSEQNFALEIRFSPYYPAIDDEPGIGTDPATGEKRRPFEQAFGSGPRLFVGFEFDWQTYRIPYVGTIGPGLGAGIVGMSRTAETKVSHVPSGDEYSLSIYPFYLAAVLRADVFWREAGIPLVPYGKLGIGYALWRASTPGGTSVAKDAGREVSGKGSTWGTHLALGLAVPLDALDRGASVNMDNATGINGTYLYFEYYWLNLTGLGQERALYVGTTTWAAGMAFEF